MLCPKIRPKLDVIKVMIFLGGGTFKPCQTFLRACKDKKVYNYGEDFVEDDGTVTKKKGRTIIDHRGLNVPDDFPIPNTTRVKKACFQLAAGVGFSRVSCMSGHFHYPVHLRIVPFVIEPMKRRVEKFLPLALAQCMSNTPRSMLRGRHIMMVRLECQAVMVFLNEAIQKLLTEDRVVEAIELIKEYGNLCVCLHSLDEIIKTHKELCNFLIYCGIKEVTLWHDLQLVRYTGASPTPHWWVDQEIFVQAKKRSQERLSFRSCISEIAAA